MKYPEFSILYGGQDSCSGDSGGPLISRAPDGPWILTAIISVGTVKCDSSLPGIYTEVAAFYDWIQGAVQSQGGQ